LKSQQTWAEAWVGIYARGTVAAACWNRCLHEEHPTSQKSGARTGGRNPEHWATSQDLSEFSEWACYILATFRRLVPEFADLAGRNPGFTQDRRGSRQGSVAESGDPVESPHERIGLPSVLVDPGSWSGRSHCAHSESQGSVCFPNREAPDIERVFRRGMRVVRNTTTPDYQLLLHPSGVAVRPTTP